MEKEQGERFFLVKIPACPAFLYMCLLQERGELVTYFVG